MMTAPDLLGVLSMLDGGDLDVAVLLPQLEEERSVLAEAGYGTIAGRPVRCMDAGTQVHM